MGIGSIDISKAKRLSVAKIKESIEELRKQPGRDKTEASKLLKIANKIITKQRAYTKEDIVSLIKNFIGGDIRRAEKGFSLMIEQGVIEGAINPDIYFLKGSTPF